MLRARRSVKVVVCALSADLVRTIADYLGDTSCSAEDVFANLKKLLKLLTVRCKKQMLQIEALKMTLEKKDQINVFLFSHFRM